MAEAVDVKPPSTLYEILELTPSATLQDVKKAYRRLALKYHPDRNDPSEKETATVKFRQVNEAYEVLSDPDRRRQYDQELKYGRSHGGTSETTGWTQTYSPGRFSHFHHNYRDPFSQFNDLFQNDPFFKEAFKDMDDLFAQTFQQQQPQSGGAFNSQRRTNQQQQQQQQPVPKKQPKSWAGWIADCLGIDFQVQTSTTRFGPDGNAYTSHSSTSYGGNKGRNSRSGTANGVYSTSTYTSKSTSSVIENGQRVTIQSLERDGNRIEEKYINNELVQRLINGIPEQQYQIEHGGGGGGGAAARSVTGDL